MQSANNMLASLFRVDEGNSCPYNSPFKALIKRKKAVLLPKIGATAKKKLLIHSSPPFNEIILTNQ